MTPFNQAVLARGVLRYLLIPFVVLGVLAGTLYADALVLGELLRLCPPAAFTPAFDFDPPRCDDLRLGAASVLALLASHLLAVAAIAWLAAFLATERKPLAALGAALPSTWALMVIGVFTADVDGFSLPGGALPLVQVIVVLWAAFCVYRLGRRYGAALEWPRGWHVAAVVTGLLLLVPYGLVFAASFNVLAAGLVVWWF